jgi:hypothetical protein
MAYYLTEMKPRLGAHGIFGHPNEETCHLRNKDAQDV